MGWIVGGQLLEDSFYIRTGEHFLPKWNRLERDMGWIVRGSAAGGQFYIRTGQENTSCPNGIGESGTWAG